jgi:CMP-N,N'-diacetyllegionaminic acid synthase
MTTMRVLGLIPARGGSRGVPGKNTRPLQGKPLLAYTAEAALAASSLARVVLTTEDPEIALVGRKLGLDVPFERPAELARDETPMLPVVQHAVRLLEQAGDVFDAICLLQPTNPLRSSATIDACVELLERTGADAVVTTLPVPAEYNPHWAFIPSAEGWLRIATNDTVIIPRRQELPPAVHREGSVYVTRRNVLVEGNSLYGARLAGHAVDPKYSVNIDTWEDWHRAERLLAESISARVEERR